MLRVDNSAVRAAQIEKLKRLRAERDPAAVQDRARRARPTRRATGDGNLLALADRRGAGAGDRRRDQRGARGRVRDASAPQGVRNELEGVVPEAVENRSLVLFDRGDEVTVQAGDEGIRFLLVSGRPLEEPVAWQGPIVMNTQAELRKAWSELSDGTFIKSR